MSGPVAVSGSRRARPHSRRRPRAFGSLDSFVKALDETSPLSAGLDATERYIQEMDSFVKALDETSPLSAGLEEKLKRHDAPLTQRERALVRSAAAYSRGRTEAAAYYLVEHD